MTDAVAEPELVRQKHTSSSDTVYDVNPRFMTALPQESFYCRGTQGDECTITNEDKMRRLTTEHIAPRDREIC